MKLLIIGGVAGGASAAAKARRMSEDAQIILFERGEYISFANCGLPYHVGKVIPNRDNLLLMTPESFYARTGVDVRIKQEVTKIETEAKKVQVKNHETGKTYEETYDKLIIATGSSPICPPIPGADDENVMVLWTIPDMDKIKKRVDDGIKSAVVVGGGFIGVEVAENLVERGVNTTLVEMMPQILPSLDQEMAQQLHEAFSENGVNLLLKQQVTEIKRIEDDNKNFKHLEVILKSGKKIETDLVVMSVGIKPNSELAKEAGLKLGVRNSIEVNESLQTSNPNIYAVGDVIQIKHLVLEQPTVIPLAGPANRQGRIVAMNIFGKNEVYKGSMGTSICKVFHLAAGSTGANEKQLKQANIEYIKFYVHADSHVTYYPGAALMHIKVLMKKDGTLLGTQIIGCDGVDKRVDVLATAVMKKMKVQELEELESSYSPPYGSAKDAINHIGFVGHNILKGETEIVCPDNMPQDAFIVDVREPSEVVCGKIPGSLNIPLGQVRERIDEIPKDKLIVLSCKTGKTSYIAERILKAKGYNCKNLSGSYFTWKLFNPQPLVVEKKAQHNCCGDTICKEKDVQLIKKGEFIELNACGMQCPGPIVSVKEKIDQMSPGDLLHVTASDQGFYKDVPAWCESTGNKLVELKRVGTNVEAVIRKQEQDKGAQVVMQNNNKSTTIVVFSNDLDKTMAAFIIANGFASLGHKVSMFFTFWGLNVLRKAKGPKVKKDFLSRMFGFMMPKGSKKLALSKMHMMGAGTVMMKYVMKSKNVDDLPTLIKQAQKMGVEFIACEMAMNVMGIKEEELLDGISTAGVANFAALSEKSSTTLFI